jgi:flagellar hook-length control protein FliK
VAYLCCFGLLQGPDVDLRHHSAGICQRLAVLHTPPPAAAAPGPSAGATAGAPAHDATGAPVPVAAAAAASREAAGPSAATAARALFGQQPLAAHTSTAQEAFPLLRSPVRPCRPVTDTGVAITPSGSVPLWADAILNAGPGAGGAGCAGGPLRQAARQEAGTSSEVDGEEWEHAAKRHRVDSACASPQPQQQRPAAGDAAAAAAVGAEEARLRAQLLQLVAMHARLEGDPSRGLEPKPKASTYPTVRPAVLAGGCERASPHPACRHAPAHT